MAYAAASGILQFVSSASLNPSGIRLRQRNRSLDGRQEVTLLRACFAHPFDSLEEREHQSGIVRRMHYARRLGA